MANPLRFSKILIVDDSEAFRLKVKSILIDAQIGYYFYEARDGKEAVEQYISKKPHVVIMDILMPKVDGLTAIAAIRKYDPNAKIIVASTKDNKELVDDAIKTGGAKDFIFKPFHSGVVVMAVSKQLLMKKEITKPANNSTKKPLVYNGVTYGSVNGISNDGEFILSVNKDEEADKIVSQMQDIEDRGNYYEIIL
ncbi:response regulator [Nitrosopumilus sp.]|uniref:response regulator n=1 Tax=Nitrosopumilus sp. TaxID=2024843 RepID=UPI00247E47CB|nr:response regulator [Nitrosopumilus sp.]MCV0409356.1 response regulator [Nitrosopumilus sp.]